MATINSLSNAPDILVTGGNGFLGRSLVNRLVGQGYKVRVLDLINSPVFGKGTDVEMIQGDITDRAVVTNALVGINQVYHLSAAHQGDWLTHKAVTVDAFEQLLQIFSDQGGGRVVAMSSVMVYDADIANDGALIDENFPKLTDESKVGSYPRAKLGVEHVAKNYEGHPSVKLTLLRAGVIYGPGMINPLNGVAASIKGRILIIFGNGEKQVPLIHVEDMANALQRTMESEQTVGKVYNLVDPNAPTQNNHLKLYKELLMDRRLVIKIPSFFAIPILSVLDFTFKVAFKRQAFFALRARRAAKRFVFDSNKIMNEIRISPSVDFTEGIRHTLLGDRIDRS